MIARIDGSISESMERRLALLEPQQLIHWAASAFGDQLAMSTSFGIQSAVTLHLVTQIAPETPVIWIDTGYLPDETYAYAGQLTGHLGLNLKIYESPVSPQQMERQYGRLWESDDVEDLNTYDRIRKVEPMQRALAEQNVRGWISGLRAEQTDFRRQLPPIQRTNQQYRIYPILEWTSRDVYRYMEKHGLPQHPLFSQGFTTVGDKHSSRKTLAHEHDRQTRFRGLKQECGIHL